MTWIPAHVGLIEHDFADLEAKNAINTFNLVKLPPEDVLRNINNFIKNEFKEKYLILTDIKGLFYKQLINELPLSTQWFKDASLNSNLVKMINRLRSGHCFDKRTLHIMKITDNNICTTCNIIEDAEHILLDCKLFDHVRHKYTYLTQTPRTNYLNLLRNIQTYNTIYNFLTECNQLL